MEQRAPDDAEALRRRLYARGATDDDRARFVAVAGPPQAGVVGAAPDVPVRGTRRRRPVAGPLTAVVVVLALAVGALALLRPPSVPTRPLTAPTAVPLIAEDRAEMLDRLRRGEEAGIAAYLVVNRPPPGLAGRRGISTVEGRGTGPGTLRLDLEVFGGAGRATVLLVVGAEARAEWRIRRFATDDAVPVVHLATVAERGGVLQAGELTSATIPYAAGRRPVRLDVDVPAGVPWGAAVVFSD